MALLYDDLVKAQGGKAVNPQSGEVTYAQGYAPLPQISSNGQATYSQAPQAGGDPITNFNLRLLEMLKQSQSGGQTNAPLYQQANNLANTQIENSMAPASQLGIGNLRPGDALNARQNQGDLYNPEIKSINDRISLNNQAIDKFESALKTAKEYGEEYAKSLKPDEVTIQAVKDQMAAGFQPSASMLEKIGKYITADDWNALAEAKKTDTKNSQNTETIDGNKYRVSYDSEGNVVNKVLLGKSSDDSGTVTERKDQAKSQVINDAIAELNRQKASSKDKMANPNTYREYLTKYINAGGSATNFKAAVSIQNYIAPINQQGDLRLAGASTGRTAR